MRDYFKFKFNRIFNKTNKKAIIIASDDWGSIRLKTLDDRNYLESAGLKIQGNRFDSFDALETNKDLELLFEVLLKYKDKDGNHPVITAVMNVANPDFAKIKSSNFENYYFETLKETFTLLYILH